MLSDKIQVKHFMQRLQLADKSLALFGKKQDPEALHKLRVEVKKMKAMLLLQSGSSAVDKLAGEFVEIRNVFKKAGKIREAEINLKLLKAHHISDKKLKRSQEERVKKKGEKFSRKTGDYRKRMEKSATMFLRKFKAIPLQKIQRLFSSELRQLSGLTQVRMGTVKLHNFRKKLKNLIYSNAILPAAAAKKMKLNVVYLKKLEDTIGSWHDVIQTITLLKENGYPEKEIPGQLLAEKLRRRKKVSELFVDFQKNALVR